MKITLKQSVEYLQKGQLIALPTDTVYGLAADFTQPEAIQRVFDLKGRDQQKPLVILAASYADIIDLVLEEPPGLQALASKFWPGDLTLVLPVRQDQVPPTVRSGLLTTGFRIPNHKQCLDLLREVGPLAVTSANPSQVAPAQSLEEVEAFWGADFPIMEGDPVTQGVASTVLCWGEGKWSVGRPGRHSQAELDQLLEGCSEPL